MHEDNIIIRQKRVDGKLKWTVSGIIDWEFAGWYPEYWKYTKMNYYPSPGLTEYYAPLDQALTAYPEELLAEEMMLARVPSIYYDAGPPKDYET
ncbi:MAG: hypothetical protein MMC23_007234 [Stictis urceolatum]|nr:hypothetical protein [Stictis urceolata]